MGGTVGGLVGGWGAGMSQATFHVMPTAILGLRRMVTFELKLGRFEAAHKGRPITISLTFCAESNREQMDLLKMHKTA